MNPRHTVHVWGVANATPDSFSDGGELDDAGGLASRVASWGPVDGVDVGAESTRPRATVVGEAEERARLTAVLLPALAAWPQHLTLSVDSYKLATAAWLAETIPAHIPWVWNDVSGKWREALALLSRYPHLQYVLCHNPAPQRELAGAHLDHALTGDAGEALAGFFADAHAGLAAAGHSERVWADPCFGFGKSRAQNLSLMETLPALMDHSPWRRWVWGVSRKSFLRDEGSADPRDPFTRAVLDARQLAWVQRSLEKLREPHTIVVRAHAPATLTALRT